MVSRKVKVALQISLYLTLGFVLFASGCGKKNPAKILSSFRVTVTDQNGSPMLGVRIAGGFDWDAFCAVTNERGEAFLPYRALNQRALFSKTNYFPVQAIIALGTPYRLTATPKRVREIGEAGGKLIKYNSPYLAILDYSGRYQTFLVSDSGVKKITDIPFPSTYKKIVLRGDSLWFTTHNNGIYLYSITDLQQPILLQRFNIPGYLGAFDVQGSLFAIGGYDSLRIYRKLSNGTIAKIFHFDVLYVVDARFIKDYLVITNYFDCLPCIFDLHIPDSISLIQRSIRPTGYWRAQFWGDSLVLGDDSGNHKIIDLSNPANPIPVGNFFSDARISFLGDEWAVGSHLNDWNSTTILSITDNGNKTITPQGVISGVFVDEFSFGGAFPPYYLLGGKLWKLQ